MLKREELPECDVATTVQIIGNKWKLLTMRNLLSRCSLPRKTQKTDKQNTKNPPEKKLPGGFKTYLNGFIMPF